jgi:1-aminocyclopropane-1-carboxylate deaminase
MNELLYEQVTTDTITMPLLEKKAVALSILRLDRVHPVISGNKWFKLKFYLDDAIAQQKKKVLTFGGAFSNHIIATAAAAKMHGLSATGIIRGERPASLSPTLRAAEAAGMILVFTNREAYAQKFVPADYAGDDYYHIPEGGYGEKGAAGAATITDYFPAITFTHIACAVGTGTMMAGLINACAGQAVIGISVMKNNPELVNNVQQLVKDPLKTVNIIHDYHFGGYAKHTPALLAFMNRFYTLTGVPSDFVYTGKLFYAMHDLIEKDAFPAGSKLLLIHSGGLQGNASLRKGTLIFPQP